MDIDEPAANIEQIEQALQDLTLHSGGTVQASNAISVLADSSRSNPSTRQQLADPLVLKTLIEVIECSINDALETVDLALRCIGNACIDNDAAREEITKLGFAWAKQCLPFSDTLGDSYSNVYKSSDINTSMLAAKVLYNICSDYEAAQQQCFREHIHYALIRLCVSEEVAKSQDQALFLELFFWICGYKQQDQDRLPRAELSALLMLPDVFQESLDPEDFAMLLETCLSFLRDVETRQDVIEQELVGNVWRALRYNEWNTATPSDDEVNANVLIPISTSLIWILSDLAATQGFATKYGIESEFIEGTVINTIESVGASDGSRYSSRLVTAACQVLGNLLWSLKEPEPVVRLVMMRMLHRPLLSILEADQDVELVHSAAGLLVQLSRSSLEVREVIGNDETAAASVECLCNREMPQLKQDGIALLRALGKDSPANQERFAALATTVVNSLASNNHALNEG